MRRHDGYLCGEECPLLDARPAPARGGPRLPAIPYPDATERAYRTALAPLLADLKARTAALLAELDRYTETADQLDAQPRMSRARKAALDDRLEAMRLAVLDRWSTEQIVKRVPLEEFCEGVDVAHARAMDKQIGAAIQRSPLDLPDDAKAWIKASDGSFSEAKRASWSAANARLIRSIASRHVERVAEVVEEGMRVGSRASVVARRIRETTGITARRAASIARDQVATLQGQVVSARQTRLGITRYRWRTVGDSRVRTMHRDREGQIFQWDRPPSDGHPGQPINCRCTPEPVLDDVLAGLMPR